ncbi:NAD(P)H-dependent oxidoreductase [Streptomyces sp. B1866]|uniref:NADPH-dependent FMN reductase n=1 Tax=Streptomyces sp. B1866 TaxID=3075431 RepID=UPI00288DDD7E|nr:NAD(P)H-dependent oxidoreductase [Streptomyces sp. B1866]MDT3399781.1 NAD(P)H-dependent oxidoreductase [Streptomyces sp. B1866]
MTRIGVIAGSTRPGRRAVMVADWVVTAAARHPAVAAGDVTVELVDLADFGLPVLDEPVPARFGSYANAHTVKWSEAIGSYDGFVFVAPEYNHSISGALKNAIDYLSAEWADKAAGFVTYGVHGGTRAAEHLRVILGELKVADVRSQVALSVFSDFRITDPAQPGEFTPGPHQEPTLLEMLGELFAWSRALEPLRAARTAGA